MRLLDTSALLDGERDGLILSYVIEELDNLKTREGLVGKKARDVIKEIYKNYLSNIIFVDKEEDFSGMKVDDILLKVAQKEGYELVTSDLSLFLKATSQNIACNFIERTTGCRIAPTTTYISEDEYVDLLSGENIGKYTENHFLIYSEAHEAFRIIEGKPTRVEYKTIRNNWEKEVKPRNVEQKCLIDLLLSPVPVVAVHSKFGCGKSYLMLNYALSVVGSKYQKLIVIPNNAITQGSRDVGTLPGDILEKEFAYLGPIIDLLGKEKVKEMIDHEELEVLPIAFARGRSLANCIVFVSESQNLTDYHVKLLLGRIGENARIFFDGDVRQEDNKVFAENSGLVLLHKLSHSDQTCSMFGSVELKEIERSQVARLADALDSFD